MKFRYSARTKSGDLQVGNVEAVNREAAFNILTSHELFILSLEAERPSPLARFLKFFQRVRAKDLMIFTRQFATMLEAKIPLGDALKALYAQTKNSILKEAIFEISSDIDAGLSLSQAFERHANIFSEFFINLLRSAEVTGRVEEAMSFLADYLEKNINLRHKVRNALIYPGFILGLFVVVIVILLVFVFPQLKPVFEEAGIELPLLTRLLLGSGEFLLKWWWAIVLIAGVAVVMAVDYFRSREGKIVKDQLVVAIPFLGNLFKQMYVARFAEAANILIRGGIPIAQAIEISGHTIDNAVYREALHQAAEAIRRGELLSQTLSANTLYFAPLVSQMVAVGEQTGKLVEMLARVAAFYTREVDAIIGNLVELIQPVIMVVIGVMVGLLFASVLLPIYNLAQGF